ncbi:MAG: methyltransferase domain-containing protein [Xanthobacteraceae bacterium]|nr:methyltransferase domain-containing protein [Xanthobacteraceae bacterium]
MSELQRWNERYSTPDYHFGKAPNAFLRSQQDLLKPGLKVLSVCDGEGRNGVWLAEQGLDVHTFDFSPNAIAKARALAAERGVSLRIDEGDIHTWQWPDADYDVVVAIFIQFSPVPERDKVFAGLRKALKRGGLLLIEGYRPEQLKYGTGGPKETAQLYTRELLEKTFGDFASLDIREYDAVLNEGERHVGLSAVIDLVGRK